MKTIKIIRKYLIKQVNHTEGTLFIDDLMAHTLEPKVRQTHASYFDPEEKVWGKTAIPYGIYDGYIRYSEKAGRNVIQLKDVPCFTAIQIHPGNFLEDTDGCILPGLTWSEKDTAVYRSNEALDKIIERVQNDEFQIEII